MFENFIKSLSDKELKFFRYFIFIVFVAFLLAPLYCHAQIYTYSKLPNESVTFAWDDNEGIQVSCGDKTITLTKNQTSFICGDKTYPITWVGDDAKIIGLKTGGGDILISRRYGFQGVKYTTGISIPVTAPGTYSFTIPVAGKYIIWGYVACDNTGSMDSFITSMDGGPETVWATLRGNTGEWGWDKVKSDSTILGEPGPVIVYNLSAGPHTFVLKEREPGTQINGLVVDTELSSAPTPPVISVQGETKSKQVAIPLSFGEGLFRFKVRTIQNWDGSDRMSAFSDSDGPNAVVDGVAKPWLVEIKSAPVVVCTSFTYSAWTQCSNGKQTRTVLTSLPSGCSGGSPILIQDCIIPPITGKPGGVRLTP